MASGNTLFSFFPGDSEPPLTNFMRPGEITAATGYREVLDSDDTTAQKTMFTGEMPSQYGGGGVTVTIKGTMAGANTGTKSVVIAVAFERITVGDALGAAGSDFATPNNATITVNNTANNEFEGTVTFTNGADMDSVVAGDQFRLEVERLPADASDTAVGDYRIVGLVCKET